MFYATADNPLHSTLASGHHVSCVQSISRSVKEIIGGKHRNMMLCLNFLKFKFSSSKKKVSKNIFAGMQEAPLSHTVDAQFAAAIK